MVQKYLLFVRNSILFALVFWPTAELWADDITTLKCRGSVVRLQGGKQVNPDGDELSVGLLVNLAQKSLQIDDREPWPIVGDTTQSMIFAMKKDSGSVSLDRVTGVTIIRFIELRGLVTFNGLCSSATKLF